MVPGAKDSIRAAICKVWLMPTSSPTRRKRVSGDHEDLPTKKLDFKKIYLYHCPESLE